MVSVCLPSCNTYHLTWVSLLGTGYLFTAAPAKHSCCSLPWTRGISLLPLFLTFNVGPLGPPAPVQPPSGCSSPTQALASRMGGSSHCRPRLRLGVAPQGHHPWPWVGGGFSWPPPLTSDAGFQSPVRVFLFSLSFTRSIPAPLSAGGGGEPLH